MKRFKKIAAASLAAITLFTGVSTAHAAQFDAKRIFGYSTGYTNEDGGVAEIVAYNKDNNSLYLVNGSEKSIDIVEITNFNVNDGASNKLNLTKRINPADMIPGFTFGDLTSVVVNTSDKTIAVAVQAEDYSANGAILILNYDGTYKTHYEAGVQPDMVITAVNGRYLLTANEGEPRKGYETGIDPAGTITIVDTESSSVRTIGFEKYDTEEGRKSLLNNQVVLKKDAKPSLDLEPEYITVSGNTAYVSLQEANSIAVIDIAAGEVAGVYGMGFKNHNAVGNELDLIKGKDSAQGISIANKNVYGVYMPDALSVINIDSKDYILTANEGDAREWEEYVNITESKLTDSAGNSVKYEHLINDYHDGFEENNTYVLGGRSFSIIDARTMKVVYDSGSEIERFTASAYPEYFNSSNKNIELDNRSGKKGPEPESVTTFFSKGVPYAAVALERIGGLMFYDISNPSDAKFIKYVNTRDFSADIAGDVAPEGLYALSDTESPTGNAIIFAAFEVSGTVGAFEFTTPNVKLSSFNDIKRHWAEYEIINMTNAGLFKRVAEGQFAPEATLSKAMVVQTLYRLNGNTVESTGADWYNTSLKWAMDNSLFAGMEKFEENHESPINREEIAVLFKNYSKHTGENISVVADLSSFADYENLSDWSVDGVKYAVKNGLIKGDDLGELNGKDTATRAEAATILYRFISNGKATPIPAMAISPFGILPINILSTMLYNRLTS